MSAGNRFDRWFERRRPQTQWVVAAGIVCGGVTVMFGTLFYILYFIADWLVGVPSGTVYYPLLMALFMGFMPIVPERDHFTDHDFAEIWHPLPQLLTQWQTESLTLRTAEMAVRAFVGFAFSGATVILIHRYSDVLAMTPEQTMQVLGFAAVVLFWLSKFTPSSNVVE